MAHKGYCAILSGAQELLRQKGLLMNNQLNNKFTWQSEVRGYELDLQGIVNNAVYLQYFDHVRVQHMMARGLDWQAWHHKGYNLVLIHVDMELKKSLQGYDKFYITSSIEMHGRLRVIFHQEIYRDDHQLIAKAKNTIACVEIKTGKPVMPDELTKLLF